MSTEQDKPARVVSDVGPFGMVPLWLLAAGLSSRAIHLFAVLAAKYADRDRIAYPKRSLLAEDLACSIDSVDRALQELIGAHALRVTRRQLPGGDYTSNLYQLCFTEPKRGGRTVAATGGGNGAATPEGDESNEGGRTDAARVAAPERPGSRTDAATGTRSNKPDTHTTRARDKFGPSIVQPGEPVKFAEGEEQAHRSHHPDCCRLRGTTSGVCLPTQMVPILAAKLIGVEPGAAVEDVLAWARADRLPDGTVAEGDDFKHWRARWNATRATKSQTPQGAAPAARNVPDARETDRLIAEMGGTV